MYGMSQISCCIFIKTLDYYLASVNKAFKFSKVMLTLVQKSYRQIICLYNRKNLSAVSGETSLELSLSLSLVTEDLELLYVL